MSLQTAYLTRQHSLSADVPSQSKKTSIDLLIMVHKGKQTEPWLLLAGADDFLPVLIYVVIKAGLPHLASNLEYIQRFRLHSRMAAEFAYFYTQLVPPHLCPKLQMSTPGLPPFSGPWLACCYAQLEHPSLDPNLHTSTPSWYLCLPP